MNVQAVLLLAVVAVGATAAAGTAKRAATECNQYPFGFGYSNMAKVFDAAQDCLSSIQVSSLDCAYATVNGMVLATEHEPYANSDRRKTVRFLAACLNDASVDTARVDQAQECLIKKLSPY